MEPKLACITCNRVTWHKTYVYFGPPIAQLVRVLYVEGKWRHVIVGRCSFVYRLCNHVSMFAHISPYNSPGFFIFFGVRSFDYLISYRGDTFLPWGTSYGKCLLPITVRETLTCVTGPLLRSMPTSAITDTNPHSAYNNC